MGESNSFQAERKFWDDRRFPYGFARSGDFTIAQATLLETHGNAYAALASGERQPKSELEKDFVAFCQGSKPAESVHEKTWKRYQDRINGQMHRYSLTSTSKSEETEDSSEALLEDD